MAKAFLAAIGMAILAATARGEGTALPPLDPVQLALESHQGLGLEAKAADLATFLQAAETVANFPDYPPILLMRQRPAVTYAMPAHVPADGVLAASVWRIPRASGAVLVERWPFVAGSAVRAADTATSETAAYRWSILSSDHPQGAAPTHTLTIAGRQETVIGGIGTAVSMWLEDPKPTLASPPRDKVLPLAEAIAGAATLDEEIARLEAAFKARPSDARVGTRLVLLQFLAQRPLTTEHPNAIVSRFTATLTAPRAEVPQLMMDLQQSKPVPDVAHYLWMEAVTVALRQTGTDEVLIPVAGAWR